MLDSIVVKEPVALSEADKEFLRARSSYLTENQKEKFADILAPEDIDQPRARRGRKTSTEDS